MIEYHIRSDLFDVPSSNVSDVEAIKTLQLYRERAGDRQSRCRGARSRLYSGNMGIRQAVKCSATSAHEPLWLWHQHACAIALFQVSALSESSESAEPVSLASRAQSGFN
jgi:hypothetical protein